MGPYLPIFILKDRMQLNSLTKKSPTKSEWQAVVEKLQTDSTDKCVVRGIDH
jgi:hypothetical protein